MSILPGTKSSPVSPLPLSRQGQPPLFSSLEEWHQAATHHHMQPMDHGFTPSFIISALMLWVNRSAFPCRRPSQSCCARNHCRSVQLASFHCQRVWVALSQAKPRPVEQRIHYLTGHRVSKGLGVLWECIPGRSSQFSPVHTHEWYPLHTCFNTCCKLTLTHHISGEKMNLVRERGLHGDLVRRTLGGWSNSPLWCMLLLIDWLILKVNFCNS